MSEITKFTVVRERWQRGKSDGQLLSMQGTRCCLGFLGRACGFTDEEMLCMGLPEELHYDDFSPQTGSWPSSIVRFEADENGVHDTPLTSRIVKVNDDEWISDEGREQRLKELFREACIDVEFV